MERRTPEVSPDPPLSTSFRSSSSSSSLFSSFRTESLDFSGYPPQSELEEVASFRWLPDGLRPGTAHSNNTEGESWSESLPTPTTEGEILSSPNLKVFTFDELRSATRNFRPDCMLRGGFGCVYKGWIDEHTLSTTRPGLGMAVAVKKCKLKSFQSREEWLTDVQYLGQLRHPNLVKLIGYCLEGDDLLLVTKYMPRGSLEDHLFRRVGLPLSWATRIKVAVGVARGLSFLLDPKSQKLIHPDVRASNILLDEEFNVKLSGFGIAKEWVHASYLDVLDGLTTLKYSAPTTCTTHDSFLDLLDGHDEPEFVSTGNDVYDFGVVLLELLSGRRAIDHTKVGMEENLVEWAMPYLGSRRRVFQIMDPRLEGQFSKTGAFTVAKLASRCLGNKSRMSKVLATLEQVQEYSKDRAKPA